MKATFKIKYFEHGTLCQINTNKLMFHLYSDHLVYPKYNEVYQTYKRRLKLEYIL